MNFKLFHCVIIFVFAWQFAEVSIPVPWGHLAGKWYGPQDVQPILGLHGWQDNAGTYDLLVPLLPPDVAFLSVDLPGHGLSSRLPDGCYYNTIDNLYVIRVIMKQYKWEKLSMIGHSMSSIIGFVFAAVFPDKVDMFIGIDALKPHQRPFPAVIRTMETRMDEFFATKMNLLAIRMMSLSNAFTWAHSIRSTRIYANICWLVTFKNLRNIPTSISLRVTDV